MKRALIGLFFASALSVPAHAAHWSVDYAKSKVGFTVAWSNEPFSAVFKSWKGDIAFDPADLGHSRANVSIDLSSETSGDSETDAGIKGAQGFAVAHFPTAQFKTSAITHKSGNAYVAAGTLSIKSIARPVILPFTLTISGATAHMVGIAHVLRTDFGVGTGEWAKPDPVAYDVTINVDLTATNVGP